MRAMSLLETEIRDGVALVSLADPGRRNAISLELADALVERLAALEQDPAVSALVITGAPPAFSAGAVLDDLVGADRERLQRIYRGFLAVAGFGLPTVAAVNGAAVGAGMNLALACDVRIAARRARFECRFADLALHPGGGHTWMLRNLVGPQTAAAMVLMGESLDGAEAARIGLAWSCVDDDEVVDEALRLAAGAGKAPRELVREIKGTLREMGAVDRHPDAVERELGPQLRSIQSPAFNERVEALKRRIAARSREKR